LNKKLAQEATYAKPVDMALMNLKTTVIN